MRRSNLKRGTKKLKKKSLMPMRKLTDKADKKLQDYYRTLKLMCEVCGNPADVMHHFIPKSQSSFLRYNDMDLIPLCKGCHFRHHLTGDPLIHGTVQLKRGNEWFNELMVLKRKLFSLDRKFLESILIKYTL